MLSLEAEKRELEGQGPRIENIQSKRAPENWDFTPKWYSADGNITCPIMQTEYEIILKAKPMHSLRLLKLTKKHG